MTDIHARIAVLFLCAALLATALLCISIGKRVNALLTRVDVLSTRADTLSTRVDIVNQRMDRLIDEIKQSTRRPL